jgi:endogenous inhibitor of DNA gyrase (YacG/DUF329 family)
MSGYCSQGCGVVDVDAEPDAREYKCPECGLMSVMGLEEAMIEGLLDEEDMDDFASDYDW